MLAARAEHAKQMTFRQCAEDYLAVNASKWHNAKHRKEWLATLSSYAYPVFGNLSVAAIDSGLVFKALKPLVAEKPVTASRVRGRIETVLDFARAAGRRDGDNPADKAIIGHLLPMRSEKASVRHQPALPFARVPAFMRVLRATPGLPARMLELIVLSGMRLGAVRPARCAEFDLGAVAWVIPQARMKNLGRDQRVPLVGRALIIAQKLTQGRPPTPSCSAMASQSVSTPFAKPCCHATQRDRLRRPCRGSWLSQHPQRLVHETTSFPNEVVEQALGHRIKSAVERSYRRGDLFERRRLLMQAWDRYCSGEAGPEGDRGAGGPEFGPELWPQRNCAGRFTRSFLSASSGSTPCSAIARRSPRGTQHEFLTRGGVPGVRRFSMVPGRAGTKM